MIDRPFMPDEMSIPHDVSIVDVLKNKYGCTTEEDYYGLLPEQIKKELEARAQVLARHPEDQTDRDYKLKTEFERKLVDAHNGFLAIVLAGEFHQPSILDVLKYKGYTPRIIGATRILNNSPKLLPTIETNYLKHSTIKARKARETGGGLLDTKSLFKLSRTFDLKVKPDVAAIYIGDQHGVDYEFSLPSTDELHQVGIRSVFFYEEHGYRGYLSTVDSLIVANLGLGKSEWPGYQRVGRQLKIYQEAGLDIEILGFEVEIPQSM